MYKIGGERGGKEKERKVTRRVNFRVNLIVNLTVNLTANLKVKGKFLPQLSAICTLILEMRGGAAIHGHVWWLPTSG